MEDRLSILRRQCISAAEDFEKSLTIDINRVAPDLVDIIKNGQTQKFEFTIEIYWKTIKEFLLTIHGFDLASPKTVLKKFFELGYVSYEEYEQFLKAIDIRNSFL